MAIAAQAVAIDSVVAVRPPMGGDECSSIELTRDALKGWGEYVRSGIPVKQYDCALRQVPSGREFSAADERMSLQVDLLLARLGKSDPQAFKAAKIKYLAQRNYREVGKLMGVSARKAQYLCDAAVYWLDGALNNPSPDTLGIMASCGLDMPG